MRKIIFILALTLLVGNTYANESVVINEFSIEPTQSVELINKSTEAVDISGWYIDDSGGLTFFTIPSSTILHSNSCLVFSAEFNLNKSSADTLRLFDSSSSPTNPGARLIDSYSYSSSPGSGKSFLRLPDATNNWTTGSSLLGKFNQDGISCLFTPSATPNITATPSPIPTLLPTVDEASSYTNIYISEAMVAPEGGQNEWVEIFNRNTFEVTLANWYLDDVENAGASPKSFSIAIPPLKLAVIELITYIFNNSGDSVRLLDANKALQDSFEYTMSPKGKSLGRISFDEDTYCIQEPSKGKENTSCLPEDKALDYGSGDETDTSGLSAISETTNNQAKSNIYSKNGPKNNFNEIPPSVNQDSDILGITPKSITLSKSESPLVKPFSFISLSYSALTLVVLFLRMRFNA